MRQLVVHEEEGIIALADFVLQVGDQLEILFHDCWVSGSIAYDQQGWYFLTNHQDVIRLETGITARSLFPI